MKALEQRIRKEGRILPGHIIKVDGFLNHQVDTLFLAELADEFGRCFDVRRATKILTAEASWITPQDRILVVDDFLANGEAMRGLLDIVEQAGAELIGIGCAIEKGFQHGGDKLREAGYPLKSLAIIDQADENGFVFRQQ